MPMFSGSGRLDEGEIALSAGLRKFTNRADAKSLSGLWPEHEI